jgi:hypothetical protein
LSKRCEICGTEYGSDAEYCNLCKKESLIAIEAPPEPDVEAAPLATDPATLAFVSILWILGLGYLLAEMRPRSWYALLVAWASLSALTWVFCLAMRNQRMAAIFSGIGLGFCAIYGLLAL